MKISLVILSVFFLNQSLFAEEVIVHNQEEMLNSIHLEKKQVENMVEKMVKSGRLSVEEGSKVKREIASVKESDFEDIKAIVVKEVARNDKN